MPTKGIFVRFNGFSHRGWYQYTTFLFRRLKSPENALKRSLGIFTIFLTIDLTRNPFKLYISKTPFNPTERTPTKGIFVRFNGFSHRGWYFDTTFQFRWLKSPENALKRSLGILQEDLSKVLSRVLSKVLSRVLFKGSFTHIKTHRFDRCRWL